MKNKKTRKIIFILTVLCVIATLIHISVYYLLPLYLSFKYLTDLSGAASIGIIGGADGPTSIFVSSSNSIFTTGVLVLLSILGILYTFVNRKRK